MLCKEKLTHDLSLPVGHLFIIPTPLEMVQLVACG